MNGRTSNAQQDEVIRRTVYVSDIDHQVNNFRHFINLLLSYSVILHYVK